MNLQQRIAELMAETGWSVGDIAEIAGVSSSAVSQWKDGPTRSIKLEPATALAQKSGLSALWLATGKGSRRPLVPPTDDLALQPEFAGVPRSARQIPIVGTAKLGSDGFYEEMSPVVGGGDGFIEMASQDPNAYGLRVRGQSMFPAIRDGWFVLVEPNGHIRSGEYVLVRLRDGRRMVKELLVQRAGSIEVISVNGGERLTFDFPDIESVHSVAAVVSPSKWHPA
jgi:phage repressor protein C with HTH and peptisase S24 domain